MTVSTTASSIDYTGNGVTTAFPVPFRFLNNTDLVVTLTAVDGTTTTPALGTDYTVMGAGAQGGGVVMMTTAPATSAGLNVSRVLSAVQTTDLRNQGRFFAETHENVFDYLTMLIQQALTSIGRALTRPPGKNYYDAKGFPISNLGDPVATQDAATKGWVGRYIDSITGNINTTVGIGYDSGTLYDFLKYGVGRNVDTIAALRLLSASRNQRAFVLGYYAKGDGGGGEYYCDTSDTTSVDNGGTVIVAGDGSRWKLKVRGFIDVRQFGAKSDDQNSTGSDSFAAIQATINWAKANYIGKIMAVGRFMTTDTIVMDTGVFLQTLVLDGGSQNSRIRCTGSGKDTIQFSTTQFMRMGGIRDIEILSGATSGHGVNIVYGAQQCQFINVTVTVLNPVKSAWIGLWNNFAVGVGGCYDCVWDGGDVYVTTAHTAYGVYFLTNGTCFNENQFRGMRWNNAKTTYFCYIGNLHTTSYLVNNHFNGINVENCPGGGILMYGGRGTLFDGLSFWDSGVAYTNNLLHLPVGPGLRMTGTVIRGFQRNGDSLAAGVRDILIAGADNTYISGLTDSNGSSYDWGGNTVVIEGPVLPVANELNYGNRRYLNKRTISACAGEITGATGALVWGENVGTVTRTSAGLYRVTFTAQARTDATYTVDVTYGGTAAFYAPAVTKQTAYFDILCTRFDSVAADPLSLTFRMIG